MTALKIHLPGAVTILNTTNSVNSLGQTVLDVMTRVEGVDGGVVFRMIQSPSGRWRVFQVIWPGGDENEIPWAIPPGYVIDKSDDIQSVTGDQPRTYYDSLDLSTPEAAVLTLTRAFQQKDFPTVFLVLHPDTQLRWSWNFGLKRFENLVNVDNPTQLFWNMDMSRNLRTLEESGIINRDESFQALLEVSGSFGVAGSPYIPLVMEHVGDTSYLFDQVMLAAEGNYLIDLSKEIVIHETRIRKTVDDEMTATVTATLEDINHEVVFHLRQSPTGRWRVLQVIVPGGDEEMYPWAVP